jgi:hypothetical protein
MLNISLDKPGLLEGHGLTARDDDLWLRRFNLFLLHGLLSLGVAVYLAQTSVLDYLVAAPLTWLKQDDDSRCFLPFSAC